jgi:hypothetical protein
MTELEDELRIALRAMAAGSRATPLMAPVLGRHQTFRRRRRLAAVLAAIIAVGAAGSVVRERSQSEQLPAQQPPKVFRTSTEVTAQPGQARLVLTVAARGRSALPAYVVPVASDPAVRVAPRRAVDGVSLQRLSPSGRFLLQLGGSATGVAGIGVVDLRSGRVRLLPNSTASFGELSPDDSTIALRDDDVLTVVDVATGRTRLLRQLSHARELFGVTGAQLGWSPDGRLVAVKGVKDTLVVDLRGNLKARFSAASLVNGSQSWAPDGRSLLLYDTARSVYRLADVDSTDRADIARPTDAERALGWAGDRIVWLAGRPGAERLVTTDRKGHDETLWMRIEVGDDAVESVTWSRALTG